MGGKTEEGEGVSTVKGKRTPVFGIDYSGPGPQVTWTPVNLILRRRYPHREGV
jgi:hypothetical protein